MDITKALSGMDKGRLVEDLNGAVKRVIQAVMGTGKSGYVAVKVKIKLSTDNSVLLEGEVKEAAPVPGRKATLFFIDPKSGALTRRNPDQPSLFEGREDANPTADDGEKEERSA